MGESPEHLVIKKLMFQCPRRVQSAKLNNYQVIFIPLLPNIISLGIFGLYDPSQPPSEGRAAEYVSALQLFDPAISTWRQAYADSHPTAVF